MSDNLTAKPNRDDYPPANPNDLAKAVKRAANDDGWTHYVVGRYTAHRTYTELNPDSQPGDKLVVVRVESCERDVIADIPEEHASEFVAAVLGGENDE